MNFAFGGGDLNLRISSRILFIFILASMPLLSGCGSIRDSIYGFYHNYEGIKDLKDQETTAAEQEFQHSLRYMPQSALPQINLGLTYLMQKNPEKAARAFRTGDLQSQSLEEQFIARFNEGEALGRTKKIDEALAAYQRALAIKPDSKETKTNIELLFSKQGQGQGQGKGDQNQDSDQNQDENPDGKQGKKNENEPKKFKESQKYKPRDFQGKELREGDVKKILDELKRQENRIRGEYQKKDAKESATGKDW